MSETDSSGRRRVHPIDLLVLVLAIGLAVVVYSYLFRRTPVPRPVDPLLGATLTVEYVADRDWKKSFPAEGKALLVEDYLQVDVVGGPDPVSGTDRRRLRLRVRGRDTQRAEAMTLFRMGVYRGTRLRLTDRVSELEVEVTDVQGPGETP